jgi:hypothetical protein
VASTSIAGDVLVGVTNPLLYTALLQPGSYFPGPGIRRPIGSKAKRSTTIARLRTSLDSRIR